MLEDSPIIKRISDTAPSAVYPSDWCGIAAPFWMYAAVDVAQPAPYLAQFWFVRGAMGLIGINALLLR